MSSNRDCVKTAFGIVVKPEPVQYGRPVQRFASDSIVPDVDYPDYGLPDVKVYATGTPPWVFMGVDFTTPFPVEDFIRRLTHNRSSRLEHWLSLCRYLARKEERTDLPMHLRRLFADVTNFNRRSNRRRTLVSSQLWMTPPMLA
ncbi:hypothetical protein A4X13_0g5394 [Tilletia indica]|uniref:Uncharacterized protein n=1 Tax=Tilletia indica TaxID=43049 RepID=A0A177TRE8_9BASI|nr:hypothetical protein A4X13_0g5394 [Tilletia indica]